MKKLIAITSLASVLLSLCSVLWAYTLTFDDLPDGSGLEYYSTLYNVQFYGSRWKSVDASGLGWCQAHSLRWTPLSRQIFSRF
jgi:hypothetical protein